MVVTTLAYLAGSAAYAAVPLVLVLVVARPNRATIVDIMWPLDDERRLAAATFWGPLLLPTVAALAGVSHPCRPHSTIGSLNLAGKRGSVAQGRRHYARPQ